MKKVKLLMLLSTVTICQISFSQMNEKDFLKNYKSPEFRMKSLVVSGGGIAYGQQTAANSIGSSNFSETHQGQMGISGNFQNRINSAKYQGYSSLGLDPGFKYFNASGTGSYTLDSPINYNGANRFYLKPNFFLGAHGNIQIDPSFYKSIPDESKVSALRSTVKPQISFGFGRIEYAYFARQAMDINSLLSKSGQLSQPMDANQLKILADRIGKLRNTRYFDYRLFRIKQLEMIDSTLSDFNIIKDHDMAYFSRLNDALYFSNFESRLSGFRSEFGIQSNSSLKWDSEDNDTWTTINQAFLKLDYFSPISYAFQSDFSVGIYGGVRNFKNSLDKGRSLPLGTTMSYSLGWYPTTRTSLTLTTNGTYGIALDEQNNYQIGVSLNYYYYISPTTRFSVYGGYNYNRINPFDNVLTPTTNEGDYFGYGQGYSFNVSLIHSIF